MKIDQHSGSGLPVRLSSRNGAPARANSANEPAGVKPPQGGIRSVARTPAAEAVFDAQKVEAIRADIRAGRYRIDADRIADGMIASLRELLQDDKA